ncbi:MAG TPA: hypothetical protein VGM79_13950 [Streptosporangiaceae bacterium]
MISADIAGQGTRILRGVITQPLGTAYGDGIPGREAAGKTGTTDHEAMALFAGYTPQLSAVVGYGDPAAPSGDPTGQHGPFTVPYGEQSMQRALAGQPVTHFTEPGGAWPGPGPGSGVAQAVEAASRPVGSPADPAAAAARRRSSGRTPSPNQ